jgi:hypothetical protein
VSAAAAGLAVGLGGRRFFLPAARVAFVAPLRSQSETSLVMPRGELPMVDLAGRLGLSPAGSFHCAVAVARGEEYVAFAVESVEIVYEDDAPGADLDPLDLESALGR